MRRLAAPLPHRGQMVAEARQEEAAGAAPPPLVYEPDGLVLTSFLMDNSEVAIIQGPIGSGSSSASCMRIARHVHEQPPGHDGIRRSRWAITRDTYANLEDTTMKDWVSWFPEADYGQIRRSRPFRQEWRWDDIHAEFIFVAADDDKSIAKMLSLNLTGVWANEGSFLDKYLFDEMHSRTGRYPHQRDQKSQGWYGALIDMNAPEVAHWVPIMRGDIPIPEWMTEEERQGLVRPEGWRYFVQPPGLIEIRDENNRFLRYEENPKAENQKHLVKGYYFKKAQGKSKSWVDTRIMNRAGVQQAGKAVHPTFDEHRHYTSEVLDWDREQPVVVGLDFGRRPAAVAMQKVNGQVRILREYSAENMGADRFAPLLRSKLSVWFPGAQFIFYGDPTGGDVRGETDDNTAYRIYAQFGMTVLPAPSNSLALRLAAVDSALDRADGYLISGACEGVKAAMQGGYRYPLPRGGVDTDVKEPIKDKHSHKMDAQQAGMLGLGEGFSTIGAGTANTPRRYETGGRGRRQIGRGRRR